MAEEVKVTETDVEQTALRKLKETINKLPLEGDGEKIGKQYEGAAELYDKVMGHKQEKRSSTFEGATKIIAAVSGAGMVILDIFLIKGAIQKEKDEIYDTTGKQQAAKKLYSGSWWKRH